MLFQYYDMIRLGKVYRHSFPQKKKLTDVYITYETHSKKS